MLTIGDGATGISLDLTANTIITFPTVTATLATLGVQLLEVTTEADITLTAPLLVITGDNDSDNDAIDLQDGTTTGQTLYIVALALIDADDTVTIGITDTTCTNCPTLLLDELGDSWTLMWTGTAWVTTGNYEVP